jgi:DNA polymerase-3 subunit gamma/tau
MSYIALARRYRPQTFADVVGQPQVTETLKQAIAAGRVAAAYLFTGPRGSGKTTVARILAKAVNCDAPKAGEPCGRCEPCVSIAETRSLDVLEIDGASNNSVDDVRELRENVGYAASRPGKRKVYIIDEVHMLSIGAFNALLKTLEEPPGHVLFVFATTEPRKVPGTIVSRCQRFDFRRLETDEIRARVALIAKQEKLDIEAAAVFLLAKRAEGSLRDALSLLDQVLSSTSGKVASSQVTEILGLVPVEAYLELTRAVLERDARRALATVHGLLSQGVDASDFALGLVEHLRNLLLLGIDPGLKSAVVLADTHLEEAQELASRFRTEDLLYLLERAAALHEETRRSSQPAVGLEAAVVEMTRFESRVVLSELLQKLEGGPGPEPRAPTPAGDASRGSAATPARGPASGRRAPTPRSRAEADIESSPRAQMEPEGSGRAVAASLDVAGDAPPLGPATGARPEAPASLPEPPRIAARAQFAAGGPPPVAAVGAAASAARAPAATATLELELVARRWPEFTQELRATKAFLSVCLSEGKPVRLSSGTIELWFPPEHAFHLHAVQDALRQRELDPFLELFFGRSLRLAVAAESDPSAPASPAARITPDEVARSRRGAIQDVVDNAPAIDDIIAAFDGEVLEDHDE